MTEALLIFARRRNEPAGRLDVGLALLDASTVLRAAAGPSVKLDINQGAALGSVRADATDFQRALINVIVNARDAMAGHGAILIAVSAVDFAAPLETVSGVLRPGRYVCISVADNGPGMSANVLRRAIDPFFTTKAPGQGFGLGLALVHGFAVEAGGGLDFTSSPGQGTTAIIYLRAH